MVDDDPVDMVVFGIADGQVIALKWAMRPIPFRSELLEKYSSGAVRLKMKNTSNREGRMYLTDRAPCLKPDG